MKDAAAAWSVLGQVADPETRELARRFAELPVLSLSTDITLIAEKAVVPVRDAATACFGVLETFGLGRVMEGGGMIVLTDKFDRMALDRALANLMRALRDLAGDALGAGKGDVGQRVAAWRKLHADAIDRVSAAVRDLTEGDMTVSRLSVAAGLLGDLARGS